MYRAFVETWISAIRHLFVRLKRR